MVRSILAAARDLIFYVFSQNYLIEAIKLTGLKSTIAPNDC
jgi:hypothetical protein